MSLLRDFCAKKKRFANVTLERVAVFYNFRYLDNNDIIELEEGAFLHQSELVWL